MKLTPLFENIFSDDYFKINSDVRIRKDSTYIVVHFNTNQDNFGSVTEDQNLFWIHGEPEKLNKVIEYLKKNHKFYNIDQLLKVLQKKFGYRPRAWTGNVATNEKQIIGINLL